jgi:hypothetical protein
MKTKIKFLGQFRSSVKELDSKHGFELNYDYGIISGGHWAISATNQKFDISLGGNYFLSANEELQNKYEYLKKTALKKELHDLIPIAGFHIEAPGAAFEIIANLPDKEFAEKLNEFSDLVENK